MEIDELKQKLRKIKKVEMKTRFPGQSDEYKNRLIWNTFFNTKDLNDFNVKYPLSKLIYMDKMEFKGIIEEYYLMVYIQVIRERGESVNLLLDPDLLKLLDLPPYALLSDVKKKFRELAMLHHPDRGGNNEKMAQLLDIYDKLCRMRN